MVIVAAALVLLAQHAGADPATADAEVKQAEELAAGGDFVGAAARYKLAYAADARPELICNAGVAYYKAKDATRAHLYLSRCQERGTALDATFVSAVRSALAAVETMLRGGAFTPVDFVTKPDGATVVVHALDANDTFVSPRLLWLPSGKHIVTVHAPGYVSRDLEFEAKGSERQVVEVALESSTPAPKQPSGEHQLPGNVAVRDGEPHRPSKIPALVAIGGSVLAFAIAGVAYGRANDSATTARDALSEMAYDSDVSSTDKWNRVMGVSGVLGILGAGVSAVLVLRW